jgi:hypothetical protein
MRTREEVEQGAENLGDDRWNVWMRCFIHTWQALPQTDSGEHYCPDCCTIWTADGAIQNVPMKPASRRQAGHNRALGDGMPRTGRHASQSCASTDHDADEAILFPA